MTFKELVNEMFDELYDFANGKPGSIDDIIDYWEPILEQVAAVGKFIKESASELMEDYPEDGTMQEKTDFFISIKEKKKLVESKLNAINNVITQIQPELIGWIEANPTANLVGTNGKKASIRTSYYPKVVDFQCLKDALAEVWAEFEGVNTKALNELIRRMRDRAKVSGDDIHELLPPGLDVAITKSLTVSAGTSNQSRYQKDDSLDGLMDIILGNGGE